MADTSNLSKFLGDIADAIRTKKDITNKISAEQFDQEILSIETGIDTSDATATFNDIISPKTAYVNGARITGGITPRYEDSNPRLVDTGLSYSLAANERACFTFTSDRTHFLNFDTSGNIILRNANGSEYDRKSITAYGGTTAEVPYRAATSNVLTVDGNSYVGLVTKNSKNVYFYVFEINHKTHTLSDYYSREATSYAYSDIGMNLCFANLRADIVVFYSDSRNNAGYTAKIRQINSDCSMSTKSSYSNSNLYWVSSVSFNADDTMLVYGLSHGQDSGNGFVFLLENYAFIKPLCNASRTTYTILNDRFLLKRVYNQTPQLLEYTISNNTMSTLSTTNVSNVVQLKGESSSNGRNLDVNVLKDNYFVINFANTLYLYHLDEDTKTITQVSTKSVSYAHADYNNVVYTVSTNMYNRYVSTDAELVGFHRSGIDYYSTNSATAKADDIALGQVAYGTNGKIIGTLPNDNSQYLVNQTSYSMSGEKDVHLYDIDMFGTVSEKRIINNGQMVGVHLNEYAIDVFATLVGLTPEKLVQGQTVLNVTGTAATGGRANGVVTFENRDSLLADTSEKVNTVGLVQTLVPTAWEFKQNMNTNMFLIPKNITLTTAPTEGKYYPIYYMNDAGDGPGMGPMTQITIHHPSTTDGVHYYIQEGDHMMGSIKSWVSEDGINYTSETNSDDMVQSDNYTWYIGGDSTEFTEEDISILTAIIHELSYGVPEIYLWNGTEWEQYGNLTGTITSQEYNQALDTATEILGNEEV